MSTRFISIILIVLITGIVLAGCGGAATQPAPAEPVSEAAAPTNTPVPLAPAATEEPAQPTSAPATEEASAPALAEPTEAAAPATAEAEAAEPSAELHTFQIVADQSEATYQVQEEFFNRPVSIVNPIGSTKAIEGQFQLTISGSQVQLADNQFTVDLSTLTSDETRRDERIRTQWLESNTYPNAVFKATAIENFPAEAAEGQDVSFQVTGDMTIREVTKPQTFDVTARLDGNTFIGTATSYLLMRDYGFEPPSVMGILEVADGVTVTVKFTAQEAGAGL